MEYEDEYLYAEIPFWELLDMVSLAMENPDEETSKLVLGMVGGWLDPVTDEDIESYIDMSYDEEETDVVKLKANLTSWRDSVIQSSD